MFPFLLELLIYKRRRRIKLKSKSFDVCSKEESKERKCELLLKRSRFQSIRVAKTAKQKGSLYPPVFCSHVRGQTDLPSPFLFFSFSVLFSWIMDETRYLHIFPCSCRMLGHDQIGQGTTQHKVASRTTRLRQLGIASSKIQYGAFKEKSFKELPRAFLRFDNF